MGLLNTLKEKIQNIISAQNNDVNRTLISDTRDVENENPEIAAPFPMENIEQKSL